MVMEVEELTVKLEAGVEPKLTVVAPVKLVPVTVMDEVLPPSPGPDDGATLVMVGTPRLTVSEPVVVMVGA